MDSQKAKEIIKQTQAYARTILNSLSAHIAIIDENGRILETNQAWNEFARSNQIKLRPSSPDINYLDICESARGNSAKNAAVVARGIRQVINGEIHEFSIDYPCHLIRCKYSNAFYLPCFYKKGLNNIYNQLLA
ncbi:sensor signal transduction histidinekinase (PAS/PAC domain protein) [Desulforapulum autotrophicum HRM2]|uniref:Sensor signal transduction histidinekinase (PAS/PAC domain protein) n=1 Tax=Desulforapulum autotrophicum (strain ATCC 43914 / DSM 3382 / VKM B-1955 / HRM2) TaxID=177437 RepID=C0QGB5_DESAH|nr:sensor signal transduction histidinekinase (PAS/PAC domain-containing protein) [Desulforapulum autotrophicum]ACN17694.1 sensor signal transduction histidinekinase (PAS/PAC domain protein) [Desulforapulum autotrophicum HRM2]